jgi:hypothetical protein
MQSPASVASPRQRGCFLASLVVVLALGLTARGLLPVWSTRSQQYSDHCFLVCFGLTAQEYGLLEVYSVPGERNAGVLSQVRSRQGEWETVTVHYPMRIVFPPLLMTLLWAQTHLLGAIEPTITANTLTSRWVMQAPSVAAEIALAVGVMLVVRRFAGPRRAWIAAGVCWLFPPLAMDSSFWGQTDMLPLAAGVFMVHFLLRGQWVWAGVCLGLAAMLKPQGALFVPIGLYAAAVAPSVAGKLAWGRFAARAGGCLGAAVATVAAVTAPWTVADGLAWFDAAFLEYFRYHAETTLQALNIWYLDALRLDTQPVHDAINSTLPLLGLSKDLWGRLLVLTVLVAAAVFCWRKFRRRPVGVVTFAGLWLWSSFMLPTREVDRYIVYCIPLVIAAAAAMPRLIPAVIALAVIGSAEMTWTEWAHSHAGHFSREAASAHQTLLQDYQRRLPETPASQRPPPPTLREVEAAFWPAYRKYRDESRTWEYLLTFLSLGAYVYAFAAASAGKAPRDAPTSGPSSPSRLGLRRNPWPHGHGTG